jgi:hypothetical protein
VLDPKGDVSGWMVGKPYLTRIMEGLPVIREERANAKVEPLPRISANGSSPFLET